MLDIETLEQKENLVDSNSVVCIDMYAHWCMPCKAMAPRFEALAEVYESPGRCAFAKENIELNIPVDFKLKSIPTFLFYKDGQLVDSVMGSNLEKVDFVLRTLLA